MSVIVAVPALRVFAKVWVEKGRGWSALDELILWALDRAPTSAADLSKAAGLPRRVVLQAVLRMMRFRLVDAVLLDGMPLFQATAYGARIVSGGGEIPTSRRTVGKKVSFVVDRITGTVFARRDVNSDSIRGVVLRRDQGADVREIEVVGTQLITTQTENLARFQKVLLEDETLLYFDGDTLIERADEYLITIVDGDGIRGLPPKAPATLTSAILNVAHAKDPPRPVVVQSLLATPPDPIAPATISIQAGSTALIMGADAHYTVFTEVLAASKRRVILHSTFLRVDAFNTHLRLFKDAVRRGVRIDIFWGAGSPDEPSTKTMTEAAALSRQLSTDSLLKDHVHIHLRSTGSHGKLMIADDGMGSYIALVGSCNWLYTGFDRMELSLKMTEPAAVGEVAARFNALVAKPGFRPEVGTELHMIAKSLRSRPEPASSNFVRILVGPAHEATLREASGSQAHRFVIASDKFGNSAFPNAIIPAEVFAAAGHAEPIVIYGDTAGAVTSFDASEYVQEARDRGVRLLRLPEGFHAKFLLWGDDDVVLTSLNWASWATSGDFPEAEIGVHIHRTGIARELFQRLKLAWPQL